MVVGTHALLEPSVKFKNLGLLVVDEEQRFGVIHKEKLKRSARGIDVLTLSATPIPRTLQLALTGLRDLSLIVTPPAGRKEVKVHVGFSDDKLIQSAIQQEVDRGGQVFCVVPFVRDVEPVAKRLRQMFEEDIGIIEAHGQHVDLEDRIDAFSSGKVYFSLPLKFRVELISLCLFVDIIVQGKILVATTVIENGIDMPNVNTIIVLNADRYCLFIASGIAYV